MRHPLDAKDAWIALVLGVAALALFLATPQARVYGDGVWLVKFLPPHAAGMPHHSFFTPQYRVVEALFPGLNLLDRAHLVCQIGGGVAVAFTFLVTRAFGARRAVATAAVLLFAVSPAAWFFSTQIEFHAAYVAWVTVAATVCLLGPWRRSPGLALALSALFVVPTFLCHEIFAILGPGWVLLVQYARTRQGAGSYSLRGLVLLVGPVLLAAMGVAILVEPWIASGKDAANVSDEVQVLTRFLRTGFFFETLLDGWLKPLALLLPFAAVGLWGFVRERREEPWRPACLAVLIGVPLVFFLFVFNVPERGGFALGVAPFLTACAARGLEACRQGLVKRGAGPIAGAGASGVAATVVLVALQGAAAWSRRMAFDYGYDPLERVARVREVLGEEGDLLMGHSFAPAIHRFLPGIKEPSIERQAISAFDSGVPVETFMRRMRRLAPDPTVRPVALDLNILKVPDFEEFDTFPEFYRRFEVDLKPYFEAFVEFLETEYETTLFDDPYWPLLRLDRRRESSDPPGGPDRSGDSGGDGDD